MINWMMQNHIDPLAMLLFMTLLVGLLVGREIGTK